MIRKTIAIWALLCSVAFCQPVQVNTAIGKICLLTADVPTTWIGTDSKTGESWQCMPFENGTKCVVETSAKTKVIVLGFSPSTDITKPPPVKQYSIVIGEVVPPDPGPDPKPDPDNPPEPKPDPIAEWSAAVRQWTSELPSDAKGLAGAVAGAFAMTAEAAGNSLFTGPEIRAYLDSELAKIAGIEKWQHWQVKVILGNGEWARKEFRDAGEWKQRLAETAAGIRAAIPLPTINESIPLMIPNAIEIAVDDERHFQIRNGRLLQYRCPQNGKRCSWVDVGRLIGKDRRDGVAFYLVQ